MSVWLSEAELRRTRPAELSAPSPIPAQVVSNGEYMPPPQSEGQRRVARELAELADLYGRRLGLDRRRFLKTSCGMAAAFLAMNRVYGALFDTFLSEGTLNAPMSASLLLTFFLPTSTASGALPS